jgi:hypothetical protein
MVCVCTSFANRPSPHVRPAEATRIAGCPLGYGDTSTDAANSTYGYDTLNRLTSRTSPSITRGWFYEANGNRQTETGTAASTYMIARPRDRVSETVCSVRQLDGVDSSLSIETKVMLAPVIAEQLQTTTVDVLSSLKSGAWTILYVNPHDADESFLFYSGDPLTSRYVTLGWRSHSKRRIINPYVRTGWARIAIDICSSIASAKAWGRMPSGTSYTSTAGQPTLIGPFRPIRLAIAAHAHAASGSADPTSIGNAGPCVD